MKIYTISGLGADQRVFQELKLDYELVSLSWITPKKDESIESYSARLAKGIDTSEEFIVFGVSFGGFVAVEIAKQLKPRLTILLSTCELKDELPFIYRFVGGLRVIKLLPSFCFYFPKSIAYWFFGAKNKQLLSDILDASDSKFTKWAVGVLCAWQNKVLLDNRIKISGEMDRLLPPHHSNEIIKGGHHFMIVDKANEISQLLNNKISSYLSKSVGRVKN